MIDHSQPVHSSGRAHVRDWPETLVLYLVDRLPPDEAAEVRAYVHADRDTSRRVAAVRRSIDELARDLRPARPRPSVRDRLFERIDAEPAGLVDRPRRFVLPARLHRAPSIAAAVAFCALVALVATLAADRTDAQRMLIHGEDAPPSGDAPPGEDTPAPDAATASRMLEMVVRGVFTPVAGADGADATADGETEGVQVATRDSGHFLYDPRTHSFWLYLPELPPPGDGNSYLLCLTSKAENSPFYRAGEVNVDERGHGWLELDVDMNDFASARILRGPQGEPERALDAMDEVLIGHFER